MAEPLPATNFDTPENRYFKGVLWATYRSIRSLSRASETEDEDTEKDSQRRFFASIQPDLKAMARRLETLLRSAFLASVGKESVVRPTSMVLHKHPLYSRFDRLARLLNGGLSFAGDIVPIGLKDVALLYEYWCFIKLVDLLWRRFDLRSQSVIQVRRMRLAVVLAKGRSSAFEFQHVRTGKTLYLVYNRLFAALPTINQKPDNVIEIASADRFYIFDAKYRVQFDSSYLDSYGGPGPTTDDVNTMHRYRNAIVLPHPMKPDKYQRGVVIGAAVLFPFPDETAYRDHHFFLSLKAVEIGGLPFLPGKTTLVEKKIDDLLTGGLLEPA